MVAAIAQLVERLHGKEEVPGSNPGRGSLERAWRDSSVGQSARLIIVRSRVRVPVPLPLPKSSNSAVAISTTSYTGMAGCVAGK